MKIVTPAVDKYIYSLLPKRDPILAEMEAHAKRHDVPIVGPAVGRLLAFLVTMTGAKRIFEMGSAIGYSTLWLARAAGPGAEIFYTDGNPENAKRAQASFERAGVADRIHVQVGNALDLLKKEPGDPESRTVTSTPSNSAVPVLISNSRAPSPSPLIACKALTIKLRITCCS